VVSIATPDTSVDGDIHKGTPEELARKMAELLLRKESI